MAVPPSVDLWADLLVMPRSSGRAGPISRPSRTRAELLGRWNLRPLKIEQRMSYWPGRWRLRLAIYRIEFGPHRQGRPMSDDERVVAYGENWAANIARGGEGSRLLLFGGRYYSPPESASAGRRSGEFAGSPLAPLPGSRLAGGMVAKSADLAAHLGLPRGPGHRVRLDGNEPGCHAPLASTSAAVLFSRRRVRRMVPRHQPPGETCQAVCG